MMSCHIFVEMFPFNKPQYHVASVGVVLRCKGNAHLRKSKKQNSLTEINIKTVMKTLPSVRQAE